MLGLAFTITFLLTAGLIFYTVVKNLVPNWHEVKGHIPLLITSALAVTTLLLYIDEHPGFKGKMLFATDWIMAGVYCCVLFIAFSGLYLLVRKKEA